MKFFLKGLRPGIEIKPWGALLCVCVITNTSITVEICMDEGIGNILAAQCQCPAGEWPSAACSHAAATLFAIEDHATHATKVSCTSQPQQWNKPALKPNSHTLIRDACFTVHKDDKDTAAVVCKPTITYYAPRRPGDRVVNGAHFDKFYKDLESAPFKWGWSLQLTQHIIDTSHETSHFQALNDACTKILQTLSISGSAAKELEYKTRGQS